MEPTGSLSPIRNPQSLPFPVQWPRCFPVSSHGGRTLTDACTPDPGKKSLSKCATISKPSLIEFKRYPSISRLFNEILLKKVSKVLKTLLNNRKYWSKICPTFFKKMGQPRPLLFVFILFKHKFYKKNCRRQHDSNSDRWSSKWVRWPLDHQHMSYFNCWSKICPSKIGRAPIKGDDLA